MAETAFARCPGFSCSALSNGAAFHVEFCFFALEQGNSAHLSPIIAVLCAAMHANLIGFSAIIASRPRELMAAGREQAMKEVSGHAAIIAQFWRSRILPK